MPELQEPLQVGKCLLKHRAVMAPMTRLRANDEQVPLEMVIDYYSQRASTPGTLLITEATFVSDTSRGRDMNAPGVYTHQQVESWARVCDAVHAKNSFIFMQLWHVGRAAQQQALEAAGLEMVSSSAVPIGEGYLIPRPLTEAEIWDCVASFAEAAQNAVNAGFDGVEIHAANGYLIDQFTQDTCNRRTDQWGGSVQNRAKFCLEIVKAVSESIGSERTAVRLSPFSDFQGMRMRDPIPQFTHLISMLKPLGLAYLHLVEPRVSGNIDKPHQETDSLDFALKVWDMSGPLVLASGYAPESAKHALQHALKDEPVAIAFGRHFISNPDLPYRIVNDLPLTRYNRDTFYKVKSADGYTDYPCSKD